MRSQTIRCSLTATLLILFSSSLFAQNIMFLRESPIGWMDEEDRKILHSTLEAALASSNGTTTEWFNPESGSHGRIKVLDTHEDVAMTCRNIKMRTEAQGRVSGGTYRLCKKPASGWRFAPTSESQIPPPAEGK